jgi:16S rRNA C1402 N4-methylase RsmH
VCRHLQTEALQRDFHGRANGILIDLGVSSMQLDQVERGFSFMQEGPLDMRMDRRGGTTAADIVNGWSEQELGRVLREYGEERAWKSVARRIVDARCALSADRDVQGAVISRTCSSVHLMAHCTCPALAAQCIGHRLPCLWLYRMPGW